ncbi:MAG: Fic family protein [Clostridia bacterium]|nr:Fic family protein [Clostridia bacterium]
MAQDKRSSEERDPFEEYQKAADPSKRERGYVWHTAIGLQAVDGLEPSEYLIQTAQKNVDGEITIDDAQKLVDSYYRQNRKREENRTEEADRVSARTALLLSEKGFTLSAAQYLSIHKRLFEGIFPHAGRIRDYNITKEEWVLDRDTVIYGNWAELRETLEYDIQTEKAFSYEGLTMDEVMHHLAVFVSRLWQIHVFGEGNTRTTAVFFIKYLQSLGFNVTNDIFAKNAWYFRNAMVRANYTNLKKGIHETTEYLELFLRNLLLGENHPLKNRTLHISGALQKQDIDGNKQDIDRKTILSAHMKKAGFSGKTTENTLTLFDAFGTTLFFGRSDVVAVLKITPSPASALLKRIANAGIIAPVSGMGKGKYRFMVPSDNTV